MKELIFVYGTLKSNEHNNFVIKHLGAELISEAHSNELFAMYDINHGFPYVQKSGKGKHIKGEIWSISSNKINKLDQFEGVPDLYDTYLTDFVLSTGGIVKAKIYVNVNPLDKFELDDVKLLEEWSFYG